MKGRWFSSSETKLSSMKKIIRLYSQTTKIGCCQLLLEYEGEVVLKSSVISRQDLQKLKLVLYQILVIVLQNLGLDVDGAVLM
jgi:hypothetical protein